MRLTTNNTLHYAIKDSNDTTAQRLTFNYTDKTYVNNNWHFVVLSCYSSSDANYPNRFTTWIDGAYKTSVDDNQAKAWVSPSSTANLYLGANAFAGQNLDGRLDDFRIYDTVLTDEQITELYTGSIVKNFHEFTTYTETFTSTTTKYLFPNTEFTFPSNDNQPNTYTLLTDGEYAVDFSTAGSIDILDSSSTSILPSGFVKNGYPILQDASGNDINPIAWYKFDGDFTQDSSGVSGALSLPSSREPTQSTDDFVKGTKSCYFAEAAAGCKC
eukprot:768747-Hanusia_phi.AAC.2